MSSIPTTLCKHRDAVAAKGDPAGNYSLNFGHGVKLIVAPSGTKSWQVHYSVAGKHRADIVGRFPTMSVEQARAKRETYRTATRDGGDPGAERKARLAARKADAANTVRAVAEAWIAAKLPKWRPNYAERVPARLALYVFPKLGNLPIRAVDEAAITALVKAIGSASQAVHVCQHLAGIFRYAKGNKLIAHNPVADIAEWLPQRDFAADVPRAKVKTIEEARRVLWLVEHELHERDPRCFRPMVFLAHRFLALTAVRKMEAFAAEWTEFDADLSLWTIPAERMKAKVEHVVPLAPQAREVLLVARAVQAALRRPSRFVFPSHERGVGCIHGASLNKIMDRALAKGGMEKRHTPHGWRGTFSTIYNETDTDFSVQRLVATSIAHTTKSAVGKRYDESRHLAPRRALMRDWADKLLAESASAWSLVGLKPPVVTVVEPARIEPRIIAGTDQETRRAA